MKEFLKSLIFPAFLFGGGYVIGGVFKDAGWSLWLMFLCVVVFASSAIWFKNKFFPNA